MRAGWKDEIAALCARHRENGGAFWSRADGNIHAPAGFSTIDVLHAIGQLGGKVGDDPVIRDAVAFLMGYQNDDGSFSYGPRKSRLPCVTANVLSALGRLGVCSGDAIDSARVWLMAQQARDGGWRCATVKLGKSPETDASNPGTTLFVLDANLFCAPSQAATAQLARGIDFLLGHWDSRKPLGPCAFGIGSRFLKVEFPFRRYNLFYYVYVLSHFDAALGDPRFARAVHAMRAQTRQGKIAVGAPHKAWRGTVLAPEGGTSLPATRFWEKVVERTG